MIWENLTEFLNLIVFDAKVSINFNGYAGEVPSTKTARSVMEKKDEKKTDGVTNSATGNQATEPTEKTYPVYGSPEYMERIVFGTSKELQGEKED